MQYLWEHSRKKCWHLGWWPETNLPPTSSVLPWTSAGFNRELIGGEKNIFLAQTASGLEPEFERRRKRLRLKSQYGGEKIKLGWEKKFDARKFQLGWGQIQICVRLPLKSEKWHYFIPLLLHGESHSKNLSQCNDFVRCHRIILSKETSRRWFFESLYFWQSFCSPAL